MAGGKKIRCPHCKAVLHVPKRAATSDAEAESAPFRLAPPVEVRKDIKPLLFDAAATTVPCPKCGAPIDPDGGLCDHCAGRMAKKVAKETSERFAAAGPGFFGQLSDALLQRNKFVRFLVLYMVLPGILGAAVGLGLYLIIGSDGVAAILGSAFLAICVGVLVGIWREAWLSSYGQGP
jgi:ribosomal protein S27E